MTIFQKFAIRIGMWPADTQAKVDVVLMYLNAGAKEIYHIEPAGLLQETNVENGGKKYLTVPAHIGEIRGVRSCDGKVRNYQIGQRYTTNGDWGACTKDFRSLGTRGSKTSTYDATGGVIAHLLAPEPIEQITVTVTGRTLLANKHVETVTFEPGEIAKTVTWPFIEDFTARKNRLTLGNVELRTNDANETVITEILNNTLESRYQYIEIGPKCCVCTCDDTAWNDCWEILYKPRWSEFKNPDDTFVVDGFDDVIVMKALEHYQYGKVTADNAVEMAQVLNMKAAGIMADVQANADRGKDTFVDFGPVRKASDFLRCWR